MSDKKKPTAEKKLSAKRKSFAQHYLIDRNATQAAIRAGYPEKSAASIGSRLLKNSQVRALIDAEDERLRDKVTEVVYKTLITRDRLLEEFAKLAFANLDDYTRAQTNGLLAADFSEVTRDQLAAVAEFKTIRKIMAGTQNADGVPDEVESVQFKLHDKLGAMRDLGKHLGLFDKTEDDLNDIPTVNLAG